SPMAVSQRTLTCCPAAVRRVIDRRARKRATGIWALALWTPGIGRRELDDRIWPMKFTVNVECSPEEARRFMGLPDVTPINEALVEEMGKRMDANLKLMSGESLMSSWMSVGAQAQDAFVKLMTSAASGAASASGAREKP